MLFCLNPLLKFIFLDSSPLVFMKEASYLPPFLFTVLGSNKSVILKKLSSFLASQDAGIGTSIDSFYEYLLKVSNDLT